MDDLESQVVITSIHKAVTVAGSLCSTSERAVLHLPRGADNLTKLFIDSGMIVDILQALVGQTNAI